jgi:hypothetical protein
MILSYYESARLLPGVLEHSTFYESSYGSMASY